MPAVELSGQVVPYEVRRSARARRARIVVHPWDGVEVVLPSRAPAATAERLVRSHGAWLLARLAERPAPPARFATATGSPGAEDDLLVRVRPVAGARV